jgi:3-dehydroquinate synthase
MKTVPVRLGDRSYDILIGRGLFDRLAPELTARGVGRRVFLVSNPTVFELYGNEIQQALQERGFQVTPLFIPEGERYKNLQTVENIYTYLIAQKADRQSTLLALGGGVTGDVVGFVAATFLRGIRYVQLPTTLLGQVDSSVGGKTGVNHCLGKNLIGVFHQPSLVCIDTDTLQTLSDRDFRSGVYEAVKYGLIYDPSFFELFEEKLSEILSRSSSGGSLLEEVIGRCCQIKAEVTAKDEKEAELRRTLNFGHTLGHAAEAAMNFLELTHGEAIGYGMEAACELSYEADLISSDERDRVRSAIRAIGPRPDVRGIPFERLQEIMKRDKKRLGDRTVFVLLKGIGATVIRDDLSDEMVRRAWENVVNAP